MVRSIPIFNRKNAQHETVSYRRSRLYRLSSHIRHIINNTSNEVVNLDKLTYAGNLESLAEVSDFLGYTFEQVDVCDRAEVERVLSQHQPDASKLRCH